MSARACCTDLPLGFSPSLSLTSLTLALPHFLSLSLNSPPLLLSLFRFESSLRSLASCFTNIGWARAEVVVCWLAVCGTWSSRGQRMRAERQCLHFSDCWIRLECHASFCLSVCVCELCVWGTILEIAFFLLFFLLTLVRPSLSSLSSSQRKLEFEVDKLSTQQQQQSQ